MTMTHSYTPKDECLDFLQQLFERVPEMQAPPPMRSGLNSIARMCKLCEVVGTRISKVMLTAPSLVVPLAGRKTVVLNSCKVVAEEGDFLLLPNGVDMDMLNEPAQAGSTYRSIVIEFEPSALRKFAGIYQNIIDQTVHWDSSGTAPLFTFSPSIHETEAFIHLSKALARGETGGPTLELRLFELILALLQGNKGQLLFALTGNNVAENTRRLLKLHPARPWTVNGMAAQLGVSSSTLSRRLRESGQSFRFLLRDVRMSQAMSMLKNQQTSVAEVAEACGYASPSRFRSRFEAHFGVAPAQVAI